MPFEDECLLVATDKTMLAATTLANRILFCGEALCLADNGHYLLRRH